MSWHWPKETKEESALRERHFRLMIEENHDGSAHCNCALALTIRTIDERLRQERLAIIAKRNKGLTNDHEIQGVDC